MDRYSALIVIPCFNEANRLCHDSFFNFLKSSSAVRFLFVDDGSSDQTAERLFKMQRQFPRRVDVHCLPQNQGKGEAVRQGMLIGSKTNADLIGFWDADLATPLSAINSFLERMTRSQELDVVVGCRLPLVGHQVSRQWCRILVSRIFVGLASQVLGTRFRDTQCGAKLFRNTSLLESCLQNPFTSPWIFDVELLARLASVHAASGQHRWISKAVYELPLDEWHERDGSKLKLKDFLLAPLALAKLKWKYSGRRRLQFADDVLSRMDESLDPTVIQLPNAGNHERRAA